MPSRKLIVLDDDEIAREIVSASAQRAGFSSVGYSSAAELRVEQNLHEFDLLVLDLNLLDTDGVEVLQYLSAQKFKAPILLVSSLEERVLYSTLRVGSSLGLQLLDPVRKPLRPSELGNILASISTVSAPLRQEDLQLALTESHFRVAYQPKISLQDGRVVGAEALARWAHPDRGPISPVDFIALAEDGPLIADLTYFVAGTAFEDCRAWSETGFHLSVAVNVSAKSLTDRSFSDRLAELVRKSNLQTDQITLEITETSAMSDAPAMLAMLTQLRIRGFNLSMDDFGTGYSSLMQLHRLPFSEVKIDRTFIHGMDTDTEARVISRAMIGLGHNLGMRVVAEGIETKDVMQMLQEEGCDIGQGYYLGKPMWHHEFLAWLGDSAVAVPAE